jgi:cytochrome c-type biogenesis protein CcmH/NrfG
MPKFHGVTRDEAQRLLLEKTVRSGTASARTVIRARVLSKADTGEFGPGRLETGIVDALHVRGRSSRNMGRYSQKRIRQTTHRHCRTPRRSARSLGVPVSSVQKRSKDTNPQLVDLQYLIRGVLLRPGVFAASRSGG